MRRARAPTPQGSRENVREAILLYFEDGEPAERVQSVGVEELETWALFP